MNLDQYNYKKLAPFIEAKHNRLQAETMSVTDIRTINIPAYDAPTFALEIALLGCHLLKRGRTSTTERLFQLLMYAIKKDYSLVIEKNYFYFRHWWYLTDGTRVDYCITVISRDNTCVAVIENIRNCFEGYVDADGKIIQ